MGKIVIYRNGSAHLDLVQRGKVTITDGTFNRAMLSDDSVTLKVNSSSVLDIKVNDYFTLFGENYRINQLPTFTKNSNSSYEYQIIAQGLMYDLLRCKFFNADGTGFKTTLDFPLIGDLELFLTVIANNMKRFSDKWEFKSYPFQKGETKTLTFGSDTCLSALQKICQEFKTDFWVKSENGKFVIHTGDFGNTIPVTFEYGKGNGLYALSRSNVNEEGVINRMYVEGSSENLPNNYRNFSDRLKFSDEGYLEDANLIAEMGLKEGELKLDDIYPSRTGKVTALGDTKFKFIDNTMDFDLNEKEADGITTKYLKPDTTAKIHFNTGNLAGYEFEIKKGGYKHSTKEFEIIPITTTSGQKIPDLTSGAFQFAVNDEYVLIDIYAPEIYITNAENKLLAKATEQFALKKQVEVSYDLIVDPEYIKNLQTKINVGDYVRVKDTKLGVDKVIRVNSIAQNFIKGGEWRENDYKITIADTYEISHASQLILDVREIQNVNNITNQGEINYSLIGMKSTRELQSMVFDTDGYFDPVNIKPHSIETNMLSVGSQSQQLSCSVIFRVNADGLKNKIVSESGKLFSQTFNKTWDIPALTFNVPDDVARYVYARCSKTGTSGSIFYTQAQIKFDTDPNDYYFLVGVLHSVVEGMRVLSITIGTTTINGGLVRTGIISSLDGQTYFNLNTGEIKGKITFTNDSPAFEQVNNSIVIGGRNYYKKTTPIYLIDGSSNLIKTETGFQVMGVVSNDAWIRLSNVITENGWWTVSFEHQIDIAGYAIGLDICDRGIITLPPNTDTNWKKFTHSVNVDNYGDGSLYNFVDINGLTGQIHRFRNFKVEKGTKATDWTPAHEDVEAEIQTVQNYAETVNNLVSDIANDNKITPSEKQQLKQEYDIIVAEKPQISAQATPYLLTAEKTAYDNAYNNLVTYVNPLIVNLNNTSDVDGVTLRSRFTSYYTAKVNLLKAITDKVDNDLSDVFNEMADLKNSVNQEIADVTQQVNNLEGYVDGAFSDGIISQAEAVAIEKYINQINTEKSDIDNKYNQIYNDSYLSGTPKTNLATDYNNYVTAHTNLINAINTAISDGATTPTEKADVDSKFNSYRLALGVLTTRFQEAIKAIETATVNAIQIGGRNYFRRTATEIFPFNGIGFERNVDGCDYGFRLAGTSDRSGNIRIWDVIKSNGWWTVSWDMRGINDVAVSLDVDVCDLGVTSFITTNDNTWKRFHLTVNVTNWSEALFNFVDFAHVQWAFVEVRNLKIEKGNKPTEFSQAPEDIDEAVANAQSTATNAQNAINITNQTVANLSGYVDGAFQDGIIEASESIAIEKYINQIKSEKANLDGIYNTLYSNELLTGTPKSNLSSAKSNFDGAFYNLISSINTAIADGATTQAEKADVDAKFSIYHNAIQNLQQKIEEANGSIQALINSNANTANQNAANALAQAQNAQTTATKAAAVTSFMQTTVDGNVVSTGTLQVGSATGANAGITGVVDRGGDSVRFYAGSNYAGKDTSAWSVSDNGLHRFHHPNGKLGLEIGVKNGEVVFNAYHESGFKTYEMSPNKGLVNVSYIPESWSRQSADYHGQTYNEQQIINTTLQKISNKLIDYGANSIPGRRYNRQWKIDLGLVGSIFQYHNGTHPANEQYENLRGFKSNNYDRNATAPNGWYSIFNTDMMASEWGDDGVPEASAGIYLYRLSGGRIAETKGIAITLYAT